jgi:hypothetical protein
MLVLAAAVSVAEGFTSREGEDMVESVFDFWDLEGDLRNSPNGVGSMKFRYLKLEVGLLGWSWAHNHLEVLTHGVL